MTFAKSLRAALKQRGMTQKRLAKLVGVSASKMSRICSGRFLPDGALVVRVDHELKKVPVTTFKRGTFAGELSAHMSREKLTNAAVGELAGINGAHISRLRTGAMSPTETTMRRVAEALGCELVIELKRPGIYEPTGSTM